VNVGIERESVEDKLYSYASIQLDNVEDHRIPAEMCTAEALNGLLPVQWLVAT
jgi:hypothetical protein